MNYEVEMKFRVSDATTFRERLDRLGAEEDETKPQQDRYFNHPARDFASTDEALRIRCDGDRNCITYKGPKVDTTTKTREEIEVPIGDGAKPRDQFADILVRLGFREVLTVSKTRQTFTLQRSGLEVEVALDAVDGLGAFVELETQADESTLDAARKMLLELAKELGLAETERRSYLQMLLERQAP